MRGRRSLHRKSPNTKNASRNAIYAGAQPGRPLPKRSRMRLTEKDFMHRNDHLLTSTVATTISCSKKCSNRQMSRIRGTLCSLRPTAFSSKTFARSAINNKRSIETIQIPVQSIISSCLSREARELVANHGKSRSRTSLCPKTGRKSAI